jgi:glycosyltransferase involved in cell wall biosynthesis
LFDITTIAQWDAPAVGIVRVERELARRARKHLGPLLTFCVYVRARNRFFSFPDHLVTQIIDGHLRIEFPRPISLLPSSITAARERLRRLLMRYPSAYYAVQRMRGRDFSYEQLSEICKLEFEKKISSTLPVAELGGGLSLNETTCVISTGIDWENIASLLALKKLKQFRYCPVVHDIIAVLFPHFTAPHLLQILPAYFRDVARVADFTLCDSETTRRDWQAFCLETVGRSVPARSFPLGCDFAPQSTREATLPDPLRNKQFALFVSTIEPRKNHRVLYEAWEYCLKTGSLDRKSHRLVFVGHQGWSSGDLIREISANPLTRDTIVILENVADSQLTVIYRAAAYFVFPSFYEGYGLPLAEALSFGKACISSNVGATTEIGGDLVLRLHPKDTLGWARAISNYMKNSEETAKIEKQVRLKYKSIDWDESAARFFGALTEFWS